MVELEQFELHFGLVGHLHQSKVASLAAEGVQAIAQGIQAAVVNEFDGRHIHDQTAHLGTDGATELLAQIVIIHNIYTAV